MTENLMRHAPNCAHPGIALERGHTCTIRRCLGCGAITAERNIHHAPQHPALDRGKTS